MKIVAWNWVTSDDVGIDCYGCDDEVEAALHLIEVMKEFKPERILDTARIHAESGELDETYQCLDTWVEEFCVGGASFGFAVKDG